MLLTGVVIVTTGTLPVSRDQWPPAYLNILLSLLLQILLLGQMCRHQLLRYSQGGAVWWRRMGIQLLIQ